MTDFDLFLTVFTTLVVVVDPIGLTPMFVALTSGTSKKLRRAIAMRSCFIALIVLAIFGLFGDALLKFIGIGLPAFRIAGGILLFLIAFEMLFNKRGQRREETAEQEEFDDPSVFPLATPLIAGPGAIATMILYVGNDSENWAHTGVVLAAMAAVLLIVFVFFYFANFLEHLLGKTGINVITRLLGMLLAALAVQFVIDGLRGLGVLL